MKKLWARVGMELEVTDEEYESIQEKAMGEDYCFDEDSELAKRFISDGKLSGESYVPDDCLDEWKDIKVDLSYDEMRAINERIIDTMINGRIIDMNNYLNETDIELADVQQTVGALEKKLAYWKTNYPHATYEIEQMMTALEVLNDLENDVTNME